MSEGTGTIDAAGAVLVAEYVALCARTGRAPAWCLDCGSWTGGAICEDCKGTGTVADDGSLTGEVGRPVACSCTGLVVA